MVTRVLDTSVVVKWFFEEEGTPEALVLLRELLDGSCRVRVPSSFFYEFANVVRSRTLQSESFGADDARTVWAELLTLPLSVSDWSDSVPAALDLALDRDVAVYDAVFVALARRFDCDLVTADRLLWDRVAGECPWVKLMSDVVTTPAPPPETEGGDHGE